MKCDICNKSFKSPSSLNYHKTNKVCTKYQCIYCSKNFINAQGLSYHLTNKVCGAKPIPVKVEFKKKVCCELSQLTLEKIQEIDPKLLKTAIKHKAEAYKVSCLIKEIFSNDKFLYYWSICIPTKTAQVVYVYNSSYDKWLLEPKKKVLLSVIEWAIAIVDQYLRLNYDTVLIAKIDMINDKELINDVFCGLYNQKDKIKMLVVK